MSVPFQQFYSFVTKVAAGVFANALNADTDVLRVYLSNAAPNLATMTQKADLAEITNEHGYAAPVDTQNAASQATTVITVVGTDIVITAAGGTVGPFRYVVLYDDTPAGDPLIGVWDYGAALTLQDGDSFTIDFGASLFTVGA